MNKHPKPEASPLPKSTHHGRRRKRVKRPIIRTEKDKPPNLCNLPIE